MSLRNTPPVSQKLIKKFEDIEANHVPSLQVAEPITEPKAKRQLLPGLSPLTLEELRAKGCEPPIFAVDQLFLKNGINAISGVPESHKSFVVLDVIRCICLGLPFLGIFSTLLGKVLLIDEENGEGRILTRFDCLTDEKLAVYIMSDGHIKLDNPGTDEAIIEFCHAEDIGTVVIDSLSSIHDADESSNPKMAKVFEHFLRLKQAKLTVFFIHHEPKGSGNDPNKASLRGAGDILAKCDTHISFRHPPNNVNTIIAKQLKNRDADRLPEFTIAVNRKEDRTWFEYIGEAPKQVGMVQRTDRAIIDLLTTDGEMYQKQIIDTLSIVEKVGGKKKIASRLEALVSDGALKLRAAADEHNRSYYSVNTERNDE
jgi:hypothetical protein